jgi:lipopolysaccharide biosynthesis glycosyltransferase
VPTDGAAAHGRRSGTDAPAVRGGTPSQLPVERGGRTLGGRHDLPTVPAVSASRVVIACSADRSYAVPLAVMLRSAAAHLDPAHGLVVYAVDGGITQDARDRVARSLGTRGTLHWVPPRREGFAGLPLWGRMPIATYDKLAIARLLPETVRRVLWLDADLLLRADPAPLWNTDLAGAVAGACIDARVPTVGARFGVHRFAAHGLAAADPYFNAGVMLVDLDRWRAEEIEQRALAYLRDAGSQVHFWDQEGLNAALAGRWRPLSPVWNWSPNTGATGAAPGAPRILHFSGNLKPWRYAGRLAVHDAYYRTLDETAWAGWRPPASLWASVLARYESSPLRRLALPLERGALALLRAATIRYASAADLAVERGAPETT